jgi:hypothetical protein
MLSWCTCHEWTFDRCLGIPDTGEPSTRGRVVRSLFGDGTLSILFFIFVVNFICLCLIVHLI